MEIEVYKDPQEATVALVQDYVMQNYGIKDADPLLLFAQWAWDNTLDIEVRMQAARELNKYIRSVPKATQKVEHEVSGEVKLQQEQAKEDLFALLNGLQDKIVSGQEVAPVRDPILISGDAEDIEP